MRERPFVAFRPHSAPLLPARFRVGELLGRGPGTEVYSAQDQLLRRPVAVKLFPADPDPVACRRIADEALALKRFDHDGLVSVFDGGLHRSRAYLVMQLVRGHSLRAQLRSGPLSMPQSMLITALLADALAHVHDRGVVHRDVKPSNILLDLEGRPYLGDFGIALLPEQTRLTSVDEVIGTPAYLAPEQVCGGPLGTEVDIYALGLVMLECLTGRMEYAESNKISAALARLDRPPRIPPDLPERLAELLRAMTANEPTHRPSAQDCTDTLHTTLRELAAKEKAEEPAEEERARDIQQTEPLAVSAGRTRIEPTTVYLARHARREPRHRAWPRPRTAEPPR